MITLVFCDKAVKRQCCGSLVNLNRDLQILGLLSFLINGMFRFKDRRWDSRKMLGSGGMPSSHSATVTALAVSVGLQEGVGGSAFAIAVVLACVVCNF